MSKKEKKQDTKKKNAGKIFLEEVIQEPTNSYLFSNLFWIIPGRYC